MRRPLKRNGLLADQRGVALIEFILVFPLLMLLIFGCVEISRYLLINLKVQNASYAMANSITQYPPATASLAAGEINYAALTVTLGGNQLQKMLSPFGSDLNDIGMIVTSIRKENAINPSAALIKWQVFSSGAIPDAVSMVNQKTSSAIRNPGGFSSNLPSSFNVTLYPGTANIATMTDGENAIVVEVFYNYQPLYTSVFGAIGSSFTAFNFAGVTPRTISHFTFMRPRSGDLICLPGATPAFLYPECS